MSDKKVDFILNVSTKHKHDFLCMCNMCSFIKLHKDRLNNKLISIEQYCNRKDLAYDYCKNLEAKKKEEDSSPPPPHSLGCHCNECVAWWSKNSNKRFLSNSNQSRSDGSTADYYQLPPNCTELQDLISHRDMNAQLGEIFRAAYRYGIASHSDKLRDAKKIRFYIDAEIKRLEQLKESGE